ncbi:MULTISPECIES: hypothetical protein [Aeromicrobium]|uniref:hypothetical protein n=1 Tax=Aeromicrobium TaxID=2040 RepID=UPI00257C3FE7|nr:MULTISPECIES: hypothetical protein [Aeromicrobium]
MEFDDDYDWDAPVEITKYELEVLLHLARRGDRVRSWRFWFRRCPVCSGAEREPECLQCQVFTKAESILGLAAG